MEGTIGDDRQTVKNCWNQAKISPSVLVASGPNDTVVNQLAALLIELQGSSFLVEDIVDDPTERWTEASVETLR